MAEIQSADPGARRIAMIALAVAFACGVVLLWALDAAGPIVARWLKEDPEAMAWRARLLLAAVGFLAAGPPIAAGAYLWRFGARTASSERFPPPDVRMVQDTVVVTGGVARRRGRIAQALGLALIAAGLAMALLLARLAP